MEIINKSALYPREISVIIPRLHTYWIGRGGRVHLEITLRFIYSILEFHYPNHPGCRRVWTGSVELTHHRLVLLLQEQRPALEVRANLRQTETTKARGDRIGCSVARTYELVRFYQKYQVVTRELWQVHTLSWLSAGESSFEQQVLPEEPEADILVIISFFSIFFFLSLLPIFS